MAVALIAAAGRGERLGSAGPKALVMVAGRPMLEWSVLALQACPRVTEIVVALPPDTAAPPGCIGVPGGAERAHSVARALAAAPSHENIVLVHDAARPLITPALIERALQALEPGDGAAILAAPVTDTIKRAAYGVVKQTLERSELWAVQTPQVFNRRALEQALDVSAVELAQATDEATLVERQGGRVRIVPVLGEPNPKVTTAMDLALAEELLARRSVAGREEG